MEPPILPTGLFRRIFWTLAILSCLTSLTTTILVMRLAANATISTSLFGLAVAASVFDLFAFLALCILTLIAFRNQYRDYIWSIWISGAVLDSVGVILTLVAMGLASRFSESAEETGDEDLHTIASIGLAITLIGLTFQAAIYILLSPQKDRQNPTRMEEGLGYSVPRVSKPVRLDLDASNNKTGAHHGCASPAPNSPSMSGWSQSPTSSLRQSIVHVLRPVTSRSKLLWGAAARDESDFEPIAKKASNDGAQQPPSLGQWTIPSSGENFETPFSSISIPKLRSAPLGKVVDPHSRSGFQSGKKYIQTDELIPREGSLSSPLLSPTSDSDSVQDWPRAISSRSMSASTNRTLIHPLFRDDAVSHFPLPIISAGTSIVASPYAGHTLTQKQALLLQNSTPSSRRASFGSASQLSRKEFDRVRALRNVPSAPALLHSSQTAPVSLSLGRKSSAPELDLPITFEFMSLQSLDLTCLT